MKLRNADVAPYSALTIRHIGPADLEALRNLAQLDTGRVPAGEILVADVDGELWAAVSVDERDTIADPFRPTGDVVALLTERARQLRHGKRRWPRRVPRFRPSFG